MGEYQTIKLSGAISRAVHSIWWFRARIGDREPLAEQYVFPYACSELLFSFSEPSLVRMSRWPGKFRHPRSLLYGQSTRSLTLYPVSNEICVVGVRFLPGGIRRCFGIRDREFSNRYVAAEQCPAPIPALSEAVMSGGGSPEEAAAMLKERLLDAFEKQGLADEPDRFQRVIENMRGRMGTGTLRDWAQAAGWTPRQVQRAFAREIGISPKRLARIFRFQGVFHLLYREQDDLSGAANRFGYSDQSHLAKDCRSITGFAPTQMQHICQEHFLLASRMTCY